MKDFEEFLATIDPEAFDVVNNLKLSFEFPLTPENINKFIEVVVAANSAITAKLLRQYHEWLNS